MRGNYQGVRPHERDGTATHLLRKNVYREIKLTRQTVQDHMDSALPGIRRQIQDHEGVEYTSLCSSQRISESGGGKWRPCRISVDAISPVWLDEDGNLAIHWGGNVALIPLALNLGKSIHLPVFLEALAEYCRAMQFTSGAAKFGIIGSYIKGCRNEFIRGLWAWINKTAMT